MDYSLSMPAATPTPTSTESLASVKSDFLAIWTARMHNEAADLSMSDPEDRACYRVRVLNAFSQAKLSAIHELAVSCGLATPHSRSQSCRLVADHFIALRSV